MLMATTHFIAFCGLLLFFEAKPISCIPIYIEEQKFGENHFRTELFSQETKWIGRKVNTVTVGLRNLGVFSTAVKQNLKTKKLTRTFLPEEITMEISYNKEMGLPFCNIEAKSLDDKGIRKSVTTNLLSLKTELEINERLYRKTKKTKKPPLDLFFVNIVKVKKAKAFLFLVLSLDLSWSFTRTLVTNKKVLQTVHDYDGFLLAMQEAPVTKDYKQKVQDICRNRGDEINYLKADDHQREFAAFYRPFHTKAGELLPYIKKRARDLRDQAQKEYSRKLLSELDSKSERSKTTIRPAHTVENSVFESHSTHPTEKSVHSRHHRAASYGMSQRSRTDSSSGMPAYSATSHDYFKKPESVSLSYVDSTIHAASSRGSTRSKYRQHTSHTRPARSGIYQRSRTDSSSDRTSDSSSDMSAYSNTSHDYSEKPKSVFLSDNDSTIDAASSRGSERSKHRQHTSHTSKYRQHTSHRPQGTVPKYVEAGFKDL